MKVYAAPFAPTLRGGKLLSGGDHYNGPGASMPEIVCCPRCGFKVQMAESLLGRSVRCQACDERFVAEPEAPPPPRLPEPPPEPPRSEPPPAERHPPGRDYRQPEYRRPGAAGDLPLCPGCGRGVAWDYRICPYCGEEFEAEGGVRRWPRRGPRRDTEPHRGALIGGLGKASLVLGGLALCVAGLTAVVGVPLGIAAWVMATQDLAAMDSGVLDPAGRAQTEDGRNHAVLGVVLGSLFALGYACYFFALR